jgi:DNA-binding Lrp family transcriptional regulator
MSVWFLRYVFKEITIANLKYSVSTMAKSSKEQIEQDEIKVLDVLERNSKESIDEIGKSCGFSRQKVWRIIKELEKRKIIWGYTAITDEAAKNLKHFIVLVKRNTVPFDDDVKTEIILRQIDDYPMHIVKIENIYLTHGTSDWIFTFYAPDLISAKRFIDETFKRFSKFLQEYTLIETLLPVRKNGLKNPRIKDFVDFV